MINSGVPQSFWDNELGTIGRPTAEWLWRGFVSRNGTTLLTGLWKAGKTTLLSMLLGRRREGGTLLGQPVLAGKTVVISEEKAELWDERARRHGFGGRVRIFPQPFLTVPAPEQWRALLAEVLRLHDEHGIDLLLIDPLAPLLRAENDPRQVLETLLPLTALTQRGIAVMATHHPAKGNPPLGQAARGSGALLGHVDISIELRHPAADPLTRRRRLLALSRHAETPRQLLLELSEDGSDYVLVTEEESDNFEASWAVLHEVLAAAPQKLTRDDILDEWPERSEKPSPPTLWRWLSRAIEGGLLACEGAGRKSDPFRYWLPEREATWKRDNPFYEAEEAQRQLLHLPFRSLREQRQR